MVAHLQVITGADYLPIIELTLGLIGTPVNLCFSFEDGSFSVLIYCIFFNYKQTYTTN